jgi:hypothetical protein
MGSVLLKFNISLIIMVKVKSKPLNETGFVPLLIVILLIVAAIIYLVYSRVLHLQK